MAVQETGGGLASFNYSGVEAASSGVVTDLSLPEFVFGSSKADRSVVTAGGLEQYDFTALEAPSLLPEFSFSSLEAINDSIHASLPEFNFTSTKADEASATSGGLSEYAFYGLSSPLHFILTIESIDGDGDVYVDGEKVTNVPFEKEYGPREEAEIVAEADIDWYVKEVDIYD